MAIKPTINPSSSTSTQGFLEVARFALFSIATLPFSLWVALYSYSYYYRVEICQDALAQEDEDIAHLKTLTLNKLFHHNNNHQKNKQDDTSTCSSTSHLIWGKARQRQLAQVRALLAPRATPDQMIVVAGANESGKSRFVSDIVAGLCHDDQQRHAGIVYLQLALTVDSLSTLTHALVRVFSLQWLQMRHALVDVLPFAGSEILVMKERFSDRDLAQALLVITDALKRASHHHNNNTNINCRPVIVVDGLGEGSAWIRSGEGKATLERLLKWCIYVTKERKLAHIVLTGNEELVISLMNSNRITRGHVKVIGLADLTPDEAQHVVLQEWPDATPAERLKITQVFGGFVHDVQAVSREIQSRLQHEEQEELYDSNNHDDNHNHNDDDDDNSTTITIDDVEVVKDIQNKRAKIIDHVISTHFRMQVERVTAAFARGSDDTADNNSNNKHENDTDGDEDDMDPYLDPLKARYSEAHASNSQDSQQSSANNDTLVTEASASWTQLQLWHTLQRLVESDHMAVPFADLRDDVFDGNMTPLVELMNADVLGFEVESNNEPSIKGGAASLPDPTRSASSSLTSLSSQSSRGWSWHVKPATPALGRVFHYLVNNSHLKERFHEIQWARQSRQKLNDIEQERRHLQRERRWLDLRKASLLKTVDLEKELRVKWDKNAHKNLGSVYSTILAEEIANEKRERELRNEHDSIVKAMATRKEMAEKVTSNDKEEKKGDAESHSHDHTSIKRQLKAALLQTMAQEGSKDDFSRFRHSFENLKSKKGGGITAIDVVRLIKATSGKDVDRKAAESFIRAWDLDNNTELNYNEFVRMLLTDPKMASSPAAASSIQRR